MKLILETIELLDNELSIESLQSKINNGDFNDILAKYEFLIMTTSGVVKVKKNKEIVLNPVVNLSNYNTISEVDNKLDTKVDKDSFDVALSGKIDTSGAISVNRKSETVVGENSVAIGSSNAAGSKAFRIKGKTNNNTETTTFTLDTVTGLALDDVVTIMLKSGFYLDIGKITQINGNLVTIDAYIAEEYDNTVVVEYKNLLSVLEKPDIGDVITGEGAYAEGVNTRAYFRDAHAEGKNTKAVGQHGHAEGNATIAGYAAHAEGSACKALNYNTHAEGSWTVASGETSHAEGGETVASGQNSHAEGYLTTASGIQAHAEGRGTVASGDHSHAEGYESQATYYYTHAEGKSTKATGEHSHSEGEDTVASGSNSHAGGQGTIAAGSSQTAIGKYNITDTSSIFIVGNGTDDSHRSNAMTLDKSGNLEISSIILKSSTLNSTQKFKLTIDDNGSLTIERVE